MQTAAQTDDEYSERREKRSEISPRDPPFVFLPHFAETVPQFLNTERELYFFVLFLGECGTVSGQVLRRAGTAAYAEQVARGLAGAAARGAAGGHRRAGRGRGDSGRKGGKGGWDRWVGGFAKKAVFSRPYQRRSS